MNYKAKLITQNRTYKKFLPLGIVIHDTATLGATAENLYNYFNSTYRAASAHAFVDWNGVVQTVPFDEQAMHAGQTANRRYIGIELCVPKSYSPDQFNAVWDNAIQLVADLFKMYRWGDPTTSNLLTHDQVSQMWREVDHTDPTAYLKQYGKTFSDFVQAVKNKIKGVDTVGKEMFKDVPVNDPAYIHIKKLLDYGIVNGDGSGNFEPDRPITRREVAIIVSNALTIAGK